MRDIVAAMVVFGLATSVSGQTVVEPVVPLRSLRGVTVPEPPELDQFVRDRDMALVLGKALFWDMQVGSDGIQACASCHFFAGTDTRSKNQISPAAGRVDANWQPWPDTSFAPFPGPNYQLKISDFPLGDTKVVVSSQGIHKLEFKGVNPGRSADMTKVIRDPVFHVGGTNVRQVPHRSTPSVINAVFNHRQFWDGRAQAEFNGVNPWGDRDTNARVVEAVNGQKLQFTRVRLTNASLASQATGPVVSSAESSAQGRTAKDIAEKLTPDKKEDRDLGRVLARMRPLGKQRVSPTDSVLGKYSAFPLPGLDRGKADSYQQLIEKAFDKRWWQANNMRILVYEDGRVEFVKRKEADDAVRPEDPFPRAYTLLEYNFSLFLGLAIQMYESTLVSDRAPFDRYIDGDTDALTAEQIEGLAIFNSNTGRCVNCHGGAELSNASVTSAGTKPLFRRSDNLLDTGYNNIGVRDTLEDLGLGGTDPWGKPLSLARQVRDGMRPAPAMTPPYGQTYDAAIAVEGAFKTPGLRNVELTAPYFHNGSQLTLRQVVDFYARGGDFRAIMGREGPIAPLRVLPLTDAQKESVVAFLLSLTDQRVKFERAPFDHPELFVPDGSLVNELIVVRGPNGVAVDGMMHIPAVGKEGRSVPAAPFLQ